MTQQRQHLQQQLQEDAFASLISKNKTKQKKRHYRGGRVGGLDGTGRMYQTSEVPIG